MPKDAAFAEAVVPTTGRQLALPQGPIFHLQRAADGAHEIGAFRAWAGYKDLGSDAATDGLVLFQHVLSFGPSAESGRTGIHCHLAQVHIVIPTSGRGVFSYDGVTTEAAPGAVIVQHGGTVHDQFSYTYAAANESENRATPLSVEAEAPGAPPRSFGFLEFFVPRTIADVEIVPPADVTADDEASAWDHPYHAAGARFALQAGDDPGAAWRPAAGHPGLAVRDAATWEASGRLTAVSILAPAAMAAPAAPPLSLETPEVRGLEVLFVVGGSASVRGPAGAPLRLEAGDCLTATAGLAGVPSDPSDDLRLVRFFVSSRAEALRERTPAEIERLEAMGAAIITARDVRPAGDTRPINVLRSRP